MKIVAALGASGLSFLLICCLTLLFFFSPSHRTYSRALGYSGNNFFIADNQETTSSLLLPANSTAKVILTVTGDSFDPGEHFSFKVKHTDETVIVDAENLSVGIEYNFNFKAATEGEYLLVYENHAENRNVRVLVHTELDSSQAENNSTRFLITVATLLTGLVLTGSATVIWIIQKFVKRKKAPD